MIEFFEVCFSGPNLPASLLFSVCLLYWLTVTMGAIGLEALDLDIDFEADVDSFLSVGMVTLDLMNIGRLPLMVWLTTFAFCWWLISFGWDRPENHESLWYGFQIVLRNVVLALIGTKILTQPLRGRFDLHEPNRPQDLIGKEAIVTTTNVTDRFGQARLETDGSPLLLNVRSADADIAKGDSVTLIDFDFQDRVYHVSKAPQEART